MTVPHPQPELEGSTLAKVRHLLLALLIFGNLGLLVELFLLEHFDLLWQWIPITLLVAGVILGAVLWRRPGRRELLVFRGLMIAYLLASPVGMMMHLRSNAALELEMDSAIGGFELIWYTIHGATPAFAPGALLQLGLIGLIFVYRHPSLHMGRPRQVA